MVVSTATTVCLHTNGQTWYLDGQLCASTSGTLNVMGNGTIVGNYYSDTDASRTRGAVLNSHSWTGVVNVYGSKIVDAAGKPNYAISVSGAYGGGTINLYDEALVIGGVYLREKTDSAKSNTLNMYGGTIRAGEEANGEPVITEANGGSMYVAASTVFNMYGGTISGGKVLGNGGNVYVAGTAKIYGGEIKDGTATPSSVTGYLDGTTKKLTITGGMGGNIYVVAGGSMELGTASGNPANVFGGRANKGGNIYVYKTTGAPAVEWDQNVKIETLMGTTEHLLFLPQGTADNFPVAVEYHFGGTYSKKEPPVIECGGYITLSR
jgi:hypothetical protein